MQEPGIEHYNSMSQADNLTTNRATNNYKYEYTLQSYYSEGQVKYTSSNFSTLRHLNEELCVRRWREMDKMRTHST